MRFAFSISLSFPLSLYRLLSKSSTIAAAAAAEKKNINIKMLLLCFSRRDNGFIREIENETKKTTTIHGFFYEIYVNIVLVWKKA